MIRLNSGCCLLHLLVCGPGTGCAPNTLAVSSFHRCSVLLSSQSTVLTEGQTDETRGLPNSSAALSHSNWPASRHKSIFIVLFFSSACRRLRTVGMFGSADGVSQVVGSVPALVVPDISKGHTAFIFRIEVLDSLAVTVLCDVVSSYSMYPLSVHSTLSGVFRFVLPVMSSHPQIVLILIFYYTCEIEGHGVSVRSYGNDVHGVSVRSYGNEVHGSECVVLWE